MRLQANLIVGVVALGILGLGVGPARGGLINGGFEAYGQPAGTIADHNDASIDPSTGWLTTESDHQIEVWGNGNAIGNNGMAVPSFEGTDFVELNANAVGTLYQDVSGIAAGSVIGFAFAHRGRLGDDTMQFSITDEATGAVLFTNVYTDGNTAWGYYMGSDIIATGDTLRFSYASISAAGGNPTYGNFLDDASFGVGVGVPTPEPSTGIMAATAGLCGLGVVARRRRAAGRPAAAA